VSRQRSYPIYRTLYGPALQFFPIIRSACCGTRHVQEGANDVDHYISIPRFIAPFELFTVLHTADREGSVVQPHGALTGVSLHASEFLQYGTRPLSTAIEYQSVGAGEGGGGRGRQANAEIAQQSVRGSRKT